MENSTANKFSPTCRRANKDFICSECAMIIKGNTFYIFCSSAVSAKTVKQRLHIICFEMIYPGLKVNSVEQLKKADQKADDARRKRIFSIFGSD